jgi:hypothetical protein
MYSKRASTKQRIIIIILSPNNTSKPFAFFRIIQSFFFIERLRGTIMTTPYYNAGDSGGPIVVQGHVVQGQAANSNSNNLIPASAYEHNNDTPTGEWTKGEQQPRQCRDVFWAILFYIHIGAIAFCTAKFSPLMAEDLAEEYAGERVVILLSIN